jgi:hypothetical protein
MDGITWGIVVVVGLVCAAWYLSYSAARLDRLHARVEGALSALDAQLVRRAEATLELANSGALDPASALILAGAASESLEAHNGRTGEDLLEGQHFAGREVIESDLSQALHLALAPEVVAAIRAAAPGPGRPRSPGWWRRACGCSWPGASTTTPSRTCSGCVASRWSGGSVWPGMRHCPTRSSSRTSCPPACGTDPSGVLDWRPDLLARSGRRPRVLR